MIVYCYFEVFEREQKIKLKEVNSLGWWYRCSLYFSVMWVFVDFHLVNKLIYCRNKNKKKQNEAKCRFRRYVCVCCLILICREKWWNFKRFANYDYTLSLFVCFETQKKNLKFMFCVFFCSECFPSPFFLFLAIRNCLLCYSTNCCTQVYKLFIDLRKFKNSFFLNYFYYESTKISKEILIKHCYLFSNLENKNSHKRMKPLKNKLFYSKYVIK